MAERAENPLSDAVRAEMERLVGEKTKPLEDLLRQVLATVTTPRETPVGGTNLDSVPVDIEKGTSSIGEDVEGVERFPTEPKGKERVRDETERIDLATGEYFYDLGKGPRPKATAQPSSEADLIQSLKQQVAELKAMIQKEGAPKPTGRENILKLPEIVEGTPNRVKLPDFTLYEGNYNPESYLDDYVTRMKAAGCDGKQIIEFFSLSLGQGPRAWYQRLSPEVKKDWEKVVELFSEQYAYNNQLGVTLRDLELTVQEPKESFADFVRRFLNKTTDLVAPLPQNEQIRMILRNLRPEFKDKMYHLPLTNFASLMDTGRAVEEQLVKNSLESRPYQLRRFENDGGNNRGGSFRHPMSGNASVNLISKPGASSPRHFSKLPVHLSQMFDHLVAQNLLKPLEKKPLPNPLPPRMNPNKHCRFHQTLGHNTDTCARLRHVIQDLIDEGKIPDPEADQLDLYSKRQRV